MTDTKPIKALIYCRVSTKNQETDGHGLESQETRCRQYAAAKGYEVQAVFPDTMTGGGDFMKRPGIVALLSFIDAQPGERFVVVFDDLKRASRDTRAFLDLRDAFRLRGVRLECLNFKLGETPEDEFFETIVAAQGQLERKQNSRQVAQKMEARMQSGYWVHRAPVGYRCEKVKGRGRILFADEPFDAIIREAFESYAIGHFQSQSEVKRYLESFPSFPDLKNGKLRRQRVTDILTQPLYAGYICSETYGIHWLKGEHEPLISLATFDKVQERRKSGAMAPKRANIGQDFALRGVVCCADCSVPLRSSWTRGNGGHYAYYLCQTKDCVSYGKSSPRDKIEDDVGVVIKQLQPSKDLITLASAMFHYAWEARRAQAAEILRTGKREVKEIEKQVDGLLKLILAATNTTVISRYEEKIDELERAKRLLTEKLESQAEPKGSFEGKLEPALTFLANPWKLWETGQTAVRRALLKLALEDRIHYCRNEGARTPKIALPFKALGGLTTEGVCFGAADRT
ncbi:MAG: recombinase family protein [Pseudomonadota bacterium]